MCSNAMLCCALRHERQTMKNTTSITGLCLFLLTISFVVMSEDSPAHDIFGGKDFTADRDRLKADDSIEIDVTREKPLNSYSLDIDNYSKKIVKISIRSNDKIVFSIPYKSSTTISNLNSQSSITINSDKNIFTNTYFSRIFPKKSGKEIIRIKNNFLDGDFTLTINVSGNNNLSTIKDKIGFESYVKVGVKEEDVFAKFGAPTTKSLTFKNDFKVYSYYFPEFELEYQVLFKNGKVFDYKVSVK